MKEKLKACNCRGNLNTRNPDMPCSTCKGINPNNAIYLAGASDERQVVIKEIEELLPTITQVGAIWGIEFEVIKEDELRAKLVEMKEKTV